MARNQSRAEEVRDESERAAGQASPWVERLGYVAKGAVYLVIGFLALREALGAGGETTDPSGAMAFQPPLGWILVGLVGVAVIGVGLYQIYAAYEAKFRDELRLDVMGEAVERWVVYAGRVGTAARAIGVAGSFLVLAAYQSAPSETRGLGARNHPAPTPGLIHARHYILRAPPLRRVHVRDHPLSSPRSGLVFG